MARRSIPKEPEHAQLTPDQMDLGARRIEAAISEDRQVIPAF